MYVCNSEQVRHAAAGPRGLFPHIHGEGRCGALGSNISTARIQTTPLVGASSVRATQVSSHADVGREV